MVKQVKTKTNLKVRLIHKSLIYLHLTSSVAVRAIYALTASVTTCGHSSSETLHSRWNRMRWLVRAGLKLLLARTAMLLKLARNNRHVPLLLDLGSSCMIHNLLLFLSLCICIITRLYTTHPILETVFRRR